MLDRIDWQRLTDLAQPVDTESLAMALAGFVRLATGPERSRTLARYALFLEAAVRPDPHFDPLPELRLLLINLIAGSARP